MDSKTIIIAEAGVNHNGSIKIAKKLIDVAADAGADFVKFQTFNTESVCTKNAAKANYQKLAKTKAESQYEMIKALELNRCDHEELMDYCSDKHIKFMSAAFDIESINLLSDLDLPILKIPSGEITTLPYLRHIGGVGKPVILSCGMATLAEIGSAIDVLISAGLKKNDITILHCNTEYPTPIKDVNLKAMNTIKNKFEVKVGYSDHTLGIEVPVAAVAMGASVIEKHFTLDRKLIGPDHTASLEPNELSSMVKAIRNIEIALGDGIKKPSESESKNIQIVRKSIVANTFIQKGEILTDKNITTKRPGTGISPMEWDNLIGSISSRSYQKGDLIT